MNVFQSPLFERRAKRLQPAEKIALDAAIQNLAHHPGLGDAKKGDLREVFVHKFKIPPQEYLLAYRTYGDDLELIMLGPHETYYRTPQQPLPH